MIQCQLRRIAGTRSLAPEDAAPKLFCALLAESSFLLLRSAAYDAPSQLGDGNPRDLGEDSTKWAPTQSVSFTKLVGIRWKERAGFSDSHSYQGSEPRYRIGEQDCSFAVVLNVPITWNDSLGLTL